MSDALVLFERLGNDRAVGVANNNLANIAFSRYRAAPDGDDAPALLHVGWNWGSQRALDGYLRWYFEAGFGCALVRF